MYSFIRILRYFHHLENFFFITSNKSRFLYINHSTIRTCLKTRVNTIQYSVLFKCFQTLFFSLFSPLLQHKNLNCLFIFKNYSFILCFSNNLEGTLNQHYSSYTYVCAMTSCMLYAYL